jgi:formamidopyrimidine-DNA glycosylase
MPELPEVETIRGQLEPELRNRQIERLEVLDARWTRPVDPRQVEEQVNGRRIESLRRRGKYLLMGLEDGVTLVMHLRMTGNLLLVDESDLVAAVDESTFERGERY